MECCYLEILNVLQNHIWIYGTQTLRPVIEGEDQRRKPWWENVV